MLRLRRAFAPILALGLFSGTVTADNWPGNNRDNPNQPDNVAAFMANGIFDPADAGYVAPNGNDFDEVIMGRDAVAKAERRAEAVDYFLERFGVDFSGGDFAQGGAIILQHGYVDPRWNYRAFKLPDNRRIPKSGLIVHDGSYAMFVAAPATLYGSWGGAEGTVVPPGTVAVDGEYLVQGTKKFKQGHKRNVHIRFQSASPIFGADTGRITFDCRLQSDKFGQGVALGRQELYPLSDGTVQASIVNILQFPALHWVIEQDQIEE